MKVQHFLSLDDLTTNRLLELIERAKVLKKITARDDVFEPLKNKTLAMIFSKSSTRTRVSFEVGMQQLGGSAINLNPRDTQIGRGESLEDTARVISSMVDAVMFRTDLHSNLSTFAENSSVPVINGLSDYFHPCQLLADLLTLSELRGDIKGSTIAWVGDGNNVCHSYMNASRLLGFTLNVATPIEFQAVSKIAKMNQKSVNFTNEPREAVENADVVVTDTWASMGHEDEKKLREKAFAGFCVDDKLMALTKTDAVFLHCLPAYRGKEVSSSVLEGKYSAVFQAAENRLHAQKALLEYLLAYH